MNPDKISTRPNLETERPTAVIWQNTIQAPMGTPQVKPPESTVWLPIWEDAGGFPSRHESSKQTQDQRWAVEQHVETIWDQAQTVGPDAIEQLHKSERLSQTPSFYTLLF